MTAVGAAGPEAAAPLATAVHVAKRRVGNREPCTPHTSYPHSPTDLPPRSSKPLPPQDLPLFTNGRRDHLPLRLALPRSQPQARIPPRPSSSSRRPTVRAGAVAVAVAPEAGARGRDGVVRREGGREGPLLGASGIRRGASLGARRRRGLRAGRRRRRRGPVLRLPARVRRDGHRRHRVDLRVHQRAAGVRRRGHRQPPLRADPRLLRRHRHPDIRVSLVQGRADGEQGRRGARPQRRLPLTRSRGRATNRTEHNTMLYILSVTGFHRYHGLSSRWILHR